MASKEHSSSQIMGRALVTPIDVSVEFL